VIHDPSPPKSSVSLFFSWVLIFGMLYLTVPIADAKAATIKESVVKIFVTSNPMNYYRPWQSVGSQAGTGSGFVIPDNRIITNAHVISDHTFIQVRKESNPKKYTAQVEAIGHDCDLALLKVDNPEFFDDVLALDFGELPQLQDTVTVIGFPQGGDKLSITKGVVSRVEIVPYVQSTKKLLAVQIDAAINPGNSGGPVFKGEQVVGVAMQVISTSQNIGYMIPTPVIQHFLEDVADGNYTGFPTLGIEYFNTENDRLRAYLNISDQKGGVLITHALPFSSADRVLKPKDVVLKIDDVPIAVDGTFAFRDNERLSLAHLISMKQIGETLKLTISRRSRIQELNVHLDPFVHVVPHPHFFSQPPYYIYGGLVFSVLSIDLLKSFGQKWWQESPVNYMYFLLGAGQLNEDRKRNIVVLLDVLPDDINVGYHDYGNEIITRVNGQAFSSFEEFITQIEKNPNDYIEFETGQKSLLILDTKNIDSITADILQRNNIPARYSPNIAQWISPGKD